MTADLDKGPFYVGVDLGGTNVKIGIVNDAGKPLSYIHFRTEARKGPENGLKNIWNGIAQVLHQTRLTLDDICAIGLATPGTMDIPAGKLLNPPNLPGWDNVPIRQLMADHFEKPTILQNDASAAAYGEFWVGAGRHVDSLVLWTLGTGIGCGIILGETIIEGAHSHASECGHIIIQMDDGRFLEGTGQYGTLEAYAGSKAVVLRTREALDAGRESSLRQQIADGVELTPRVIGEAAEEGDALADEIVMETARYLGVGSTTLMHTLDPEMVLFGGGMTFGGNNSPLGRRFLQRIKDEIKVRAFPVPAQKTLIEYATLGGEAGYIGAAGCARLKHGPKCA